MRNEPNSNQIKVWRTDLNNWKWHFFYYNPNDKRLIVSKRVEWAGITFNYAHKRSWFWTIFLFTAVISLIYILPSHH